MTAQEIAGERWTLWMGEDGGLHADMITPTWGGGGIVVVREHGGWAVDDLIRSVALSIRVHDEPMPGGWLCGACSYANVGVACTKCGAPRYAGTELPLTPPVHDEPGLRLCHFCQGPIPSDEVAIEAKTENAWAHFECWYDGTPFKRDPVTGRELSRGS